MNRIYLHRDDLITIKQFMDAFESPNDIVEITSDSSSGIGSIITAKLNAITLNGQIVNVEKTIVDESSW